MAQYFKIHPDNPQPRLIAQAVAILRHGGVIAYPTDSCYALGCRIDETQALQRIQAQVDENGQIHDWIAKWQLGSRPRLWQKIRGDKKAA